MKPAFYPTSSESRLELLDIFRGVALCGIFFVNLEIMHCVFANQKEYLSQFNALPDRIAYRLMQLFFYSKFFPIFSMLFGLGISMQVIKHKEAGNFDSAFIFRRMSVLFILGIAHIVFLWSGDVLHIYAVLGLLTLLFLRVKEEILIFAGLAFLVFPIYDVLLEKIFSALGFDPAGYLVAYPYEEIVHIIRHGNFLERVRFNVFEYISNIRLTLGFFTPLAFSMVLLGVYLGKKKVFLSIPTFVNRIKIQMLTAAIITNSYRLLYIFYLPGTTVFSTYSPVFLQLILITDVFFGLFYLWTIAFLYMRSSFFAKLFRPFSYVGRMALSNYLLQSGIGLLLFSGFGLYERLSPSVAFLIPIATGVFQIVVSKIWLNHFEFGPAEWIWRCLSYKKISAFIPKRN
jgi:uncharacterized protein